MFTSTIKNLSNGEGGRKLTLAINGAIVAAEYWNDETGLDRVSEAVNSFNATENDEIVVPINSGGGDYFAGVAIYNTLKHSPAKITTKNMGVAASAASVIFMAGDERIACYGSSTMAHDPLSYVYGNADTLRDVADSLDDICESAKGIYISNGVNPEKLVELMKSETMMTPEKSVENGFATKVDDGLQVSNMITSHEKSLVESNVFGDKTPKAKEEEAPNINIDNSLSSPVIASSDYVVNACVSNGMVDQITSFHNKNFTQEQVDSNISTVKEVMNICAATGLNFDDIKNSIFDTVELVRSIASSRIEDDTDELQDHNLDSEEFEIKSVKSEL